MWQEIKDVARGTRDSWRQRLADLPVSLPSLTLPSPGLPPSDLLRGRALTRKIVSTWNTTWKQRFLAQETWEISRTLIISFCLCNILGHWLEGIYCLAMDRLYSIVDPDYNIWHDPWYHPYWVYGFGAIGMTLVIEPLKERILARCKTAQGAALETFAIAFFLAMVMETGFGLLVNQPDEEGLYPYWDNSELPLNVLKQGWLVNDVFIALAAVGYVWVLYPGIHNTLLRMGNKKADLVLAATVLGFIALCVSSYGEIIRSGRLGNKTEEKPADAK